MKKRILTILLILTALGAAFACGCTNTPSSSGSSSGSSESTNNTQSTSSKNPGTASGSTTDKTAKDVIHFGEKYYLVTGNNTKYYVFNTNNTCTYYYTTGSSTLTSGSTNLIWVETSDHAIHLFEKYEAGSGTSAVDTTRYDENGYIAGPIYYSEDVMVYYKTNGSGYYIGFDKTYYLIREAKLSK